MFTVQACVWYLFASIPLLKLLFTKLINSNISISYPILRNLKNFTKDEIIIIKSSKVENDNFIDFKKYCATKYVTKQRKYLYREFLER